MKSFKLFATTMSVAACAVFSTAHATPVTSTVFDISTAKLTTGSGYGTGSNMLDVGFTNAFAAQSQTLAAVGDSFTFSLGTVNFLESTIDSGETDHLGVSWALTFTSPLAAAETFTATVSALTGAAVDQTTKTNRVCTTTYTRGENKGQCQTYETTTVIVNPELVDYSLVWGDATELSFGNGGLFSIDLTDLFFSNATGGAQTEYATITLLSASQPVGLRPLLISESTVPEPGSLALLGVALAGLAAIRRKKQA